MLPAGFIYMLGAAESVPGSRAQRPAAEYRTKNTALDTRVKSLREDR